MAPTFTADSVNSVQLLAAAGAPRVVSITVEGGDARLQYDGATTVLTKDWGAVLRRGGMLGLEGDAAKNAIHGIAASASSPVKFNVQTWALS